MNPDRQWDNDPELNDIISPLEDNARLREVIAALDRRKGELDAAGYDEAINDRHFAEVDRLADYLAHRDHFGGFDQWDWAARFLTDETFRDLYDHDKHWMFEDFIKDDATDFLEDQNWAARAKSGMTKRELGNLLVVLSHFPSEGWGPQMLKVQSLIAK